MRIGFVYPTMPQRGGAENLTVWLATELARRGHRVSLFTAGIERALWPELGRTVETLELPDRNDGFWHQWSRSRTHGRMLAEWLDGYDLVVAGNHPSHWWVAEAVRRMPTRPATLLYCQEPYRKYYFPSTDAPVVEYMRSGRNTLPAASEFDWHAGTRMRKHRRPKPVMVRRSDRRLMPRIDSVLANSEFTRRNAMAAWSREVAVCYCGAPMPLSDLATPPSRDRSGVVVLTGWQVSKNPMGVLGAVNHVTNTLGREDIRFVMTGGDPPSPYAEYIAQRRLDRVIEFTGYVSEEEKSRLLAAARLCLFVPLAEPFGLVAAEAMLRGTPVIAANHGGPSEIVIDQKTGVLVDPFNPAAIGQAIVDVWDEHELLDRLGERGRDRASELFTVRALGDRFERAALALVQKRGVR